MAIYRALSTAIHAYRRNENDSTIHNNARQSNRTETTWHWAKRTSSFIYHNNESWVNGSNKTRITEQQRSREKLTCMGDFDAPASTWMPSPTRRPVVTLTLDFRILIGSLVGTHEYFRSVLPKLFKANDICLNDERTRRTDNAFADSVGWRRIVRSKLNDVFTRWL